MSTTDTPKTDAFHQEVIDGPLPAIAPRYRDFARKLETALRRIQHIAEKGDAAPVIMKGRRLMIHDIATKALLGDDPS